MQESNLFFFQDKVPKNIADDFIDCVNNMQWYYGIPGGYLTNTPKRHVNAFGDGAKINKKGQLIEGGWPLVFWTAKINQNNVSLGSFTEKMPEPFAKLIPYLRKLLLRSYPNTKITDNTFNIAVCNYYTEAQDNIAPHTDDNTWYPKELIDENNKHRPVFASITLYPKKKPGSNKELANFEIYEDSKWKRVDLPDESILIMPSDIKHRVKSITSKQNFYPRINITFRSTYSTDINPVMNIMAVANHTRYYKLPYLLSYPQDLDITDIKNAYNAINKKYQHKKLIMVPVQNKPQLKKIFREKYEAISKIKNFEKFKFGANIVMEILIMLCIGLDCC